MMENSTTKNASKGEKHMPKSDYLQIRVTPEFKEQLQRAAQADNRTVSGYILNVLQKELNSEKEPD